MGQGGAQAGGDGVHLSAAGIACMDCGADVGSTGVQVEVVLGRVLVVSDIAGGVPPAS